MKSVLWTLFLPHDSCAQHRSAAQLALFNRFLSFCVEFVHHMRQFPQSKGIERLQGFLLRQITNWLCFHKSRTCNSPRPCLKKSGASLQSPVTMPVIRSLLPGSAPTALILSNWYCSNHWRWILYESGFHWKSADKEDMSALCLKPPVQTFLGKC